MNDPRPDRVRNAEDMILALHAENERLRAAVVTGLSWLNELEHMGSIVDQPALSKDIAQLTAALGVGSC